MKKIGIMMLIFATFIIAGCSSPEASVCGDGFCSFTEKAKDNCPSDCDIEDIVEDIEEVAEELSQAAEEIAEESAEVVEEHVEVAEDVIEDNVELAEDVVEEVMEETEYEEVLEEYPEDYSLENQECLSLISETSVCIEDIFNESVTITINNESYFLEEGDSVEVGGLVYTVEEIYEDTITLNVDYPINEINGFSSPFYGTDAAVIESDGSVQVALTSDFGEQVTILTEGSSGDGDCGLLTELKILKIEGAEVENPTDSQVVENAENFVLEWTCINSSLVSQERFISTLSFQYTTPANLTQEHSGYVEGTILQTIVEEATEPSESASEVIEDNETNTQPQILEGESSSQGGIIEENETVEE
ncbi:hypothetical protein BVX95_01375 [archaeon D22]|nr:hypothetical protein BVX95_01375 [archaeon D22]